MSVRANIRLTAILTCRNAEATLDRCLAHLVWHGAQIILIDNGSTDRTVEIAQKYVDLGKVELRSDTYDHAFDLTRQLRRKRDLIRSIGTGWIIHADADEFIDTPGNQKLTEYLPYLDQSEVQAFRCDECLFLPTSESDVHHPDRFEETMTACTGFKDRNPKQRVFRASAPLSRWMATGGHTVVDRPRAVAQAPLRLRHYFGLSLDQIRSEYLARIYAPRDLGKLWHGTRRGQELSIVAPGANELATLDRLETRAPLRHVPVFRTARLTTTSCDGPDLADLAVITASDESWAWIDGLIDRYLPGLRLARVSLQDARYAPRLVVQEHPGRSCLQQQIDPVDAGERWLRLFAGARQIGITGQCRYAEARIEDLEDLPGMILHVVKQVLNGGQTTPLLANSAPVRTVDRIPDRLAAITGPFARDLGYA